MISGIYKFTNLINNRVYIGSSKDIDFRYSEHIKGVGKSKILKSALVKNGIENFKFEILETHDFRLNDTKESFREFLYEREQFYLDQFFAKEYIESNGKDNRFRLLTYNLNPKAKGNTASKWSQDSIDKLKEKFKTKGHTCEGRKYSEKSIIKIKTTHKERGVSIGNKNPNFGKKSTKEKHDKVIQAWLRSGKIKPFLVTSSTGIVTGPYNTSTECADKLNIWASQIKRCLKGIYKQTEGYTFKYIENESQDQKTI